jgi:hypothetical protein
LRRTQVGFIVVQQIGVGLGVIRGVQNFNYLRIVNFKVERIAVPDWWRRNTDMSTDKDDDEEDERLNDWNKCQSSSFLPYTYLLTYLLTHGAEPF